ncbi:MAG: hypothetical protein WBX14_07430, partial [Candidatus Udaeobacter sp.]
MKRYRRETFNVQRPTLIESSESKVNIVPLKSGPASIIDPCESLAAGACRNRGLRDHLCAHQRP